MDDQEQTKTQATEDASTNEKSGILTKIKTGAGKVGGVIKSGFNKTFDTAKQIVSEKKDKSTLIKEFETSANSFLYERNGKSHIIYGKRDITQKTILFLIRDKDEVISNMEIHTDGQQLIITEFDSKQIIPYSNETCSVSLDCFTAHYKLKERQQVVSNSIVQTNNITVGDNFQGDVNIANQAKISDLNEIENLLKNAKPNIFHRAKLQEANDMFIAFKGNISRGEKPKKDFIDKFTTVLKAVAPAAVSLVLGLIA